MSRSSRWTKSAVWLAGGLGTFAVPMAGFAQDAAKPVADPLPEWRATFEEFLQWDVLDVEVWRIVACFAVLLAGLFLKNVLISRLLRPVELVVSKTETEFDNALLEASRGPLGWLVFVFATWFAVELLNLPKGVDAVTTLLLQTCGTGLVAWLLYRGIDAAGLVLERFTHATESDMDDQLVPLAKRVMRVLLVIFAILAVIQQWGYDVTSLIAGLGIGGLAFALAAQDTLANWFGSLMIFTDRPFRVGDWVKTPHGEGVIEEVGLRSTTVRTFEKSLITVPNKSVASAAVENYTMRDHRRVKVTLGLEYRTSRAQIEKVLEGVKQVLLDHERIVDDTILVRLTALGASSIDILVIAFLDTIAGDVYFEEQERLLLEFMRVVEEAGAGFAFPSTSLYLETPVKMAS